MSQLAPGKVIKRFRAGDEIVTLRFPKIGDERSAMKYINSVITEENARLLMTKKVTLKQEREWLKSVLRDIKQKTKLPLVIDIKGEYVGSVALERKVKPPSAVDHVATFGVALLKPYRRRTIATRAANALFTFGKRVWKLKLVQSSYVSDNRASVALHKKLGFRAIGRVPKGAKYGRKYVDKVLVLKRLT